MNIRLTKNNIRSPPALYSQVSCTKSLQSPPWRFSSWNQPHSDSKQEVLETSWPLLHHDSLHSRRLGVMGARKNGAREGDTRGERELPLPLRVSLAREPFFPAPITSKQRRLRRLTL